jgi:hypothetical protein
LMLDVFFYGGSFMKAVTNVDVHEHLGYLNEAAATQCLLRKLYTCGNSAMLESKKLIRRFGSFGNAEWMKLLVQTNLQAVRLPDMIREL